ncbi:uncharacterized protein isoform X1 [Leptinotarsa decemlineata]|uniref:uncharacterized protein isoform X1 n=1 Tax=Leptinotarsa decemlineata TaxID=7539 RepID=UPI003D304CAC
MKVDVLGRRRIHRVYLNEFLVARAVARAVEVGYSRRRVAQMLNVSHSAVSRAWNRYQIYGIVKRAPYPNRQRATTRREDRLLRLWAIRGRTDSARTLQNRLIEATGTRISNQTIRNRLHEVQLHARRPARAPRLTPAHRGNRKNFCQEHRNWNLEQWANVMFTDKKKSCSSTMTDVFGYGDVPVNAIWMTVCKKLFHLEVDR